MNSVVPSLQSADAHAGWSLGASSCGEGRTLVAPLVERTARIDPDAVALRCGDETLTYGELNGRANRLAGQLQAMGAGPGSLVALCLERSFDCVASTLAVMKSGAAFLPVDLAWPDERIRAVLERSGAGLVVSRTEWARRLPEGMAALLLDRDAAAIAARDGLDQPGGAGPDDLAFVIYTSGSTGTPKGVEITHANLANFVAWHRDALAITPADRSAYVAGLGFDAAQWDLWPYLVAGASACLAGDLVRTSPELLQRWMVEQGVTVAFVTTVLAEPMLAMAWPAGTALRLLLTGGDTLRVRPPPGLPFRLINCYGPTETTIIVTAGEIPPDDAVEPPAIGWPIAGSRIHVLDEGGAPVPPGEVGEITIGGPGVGRGYHRDPELTVQRFVPDPFSDQPGVQMYRTGDLGCLLPDGRIAFRGRMDQQVKIRGNRVELEEIDRALSRHEFVSACVVVAAGTGSEMRLVAYVVPAAGAAEPAARELHAFVGAQLPSYMVPATFVRLAALPLTANGKIDRRALPPPDAANTLGAEETREPESPVELHLADIVRGLLGVEHVGADDNFFALGGHSLLGTQVILRAREAFGVDLTLRHLFAAQTIALLATTIEGLILEQIEAMSDEDAQKLAAD